MDRKLRFLLVGALLGLATLGGGAATVAYIKQTQISIKLSAPNVVKCNRQATVRAKVVSNKSGKPIKNQIVTWRLGNQKSGGDGLSAASTVTNKKGLATVKLRFGPAAGSRRVTASSGNISPSISVRCRGGLPPTSIRPPDDWVEAPSDALLTPVGDVELNAPAALPAMAVRLDRLGIDLPIVEGDGYTVPDGTASHYPDTAWPGEGSNTYIYAHAREDAFLELWRVSTGDLVEIDMTDGSILRYEVSDILPVVAWDAFEHVWPTRTERLTLQTSLWYDDTAPRFIVIAEPMPGP